MIVKNPTENKIGIVYKGDTYEVEAKSELKDVPAEVALHWKTKVHAFVDVFEDIKKVIREVAEVKVAVTEVVEDVKEIMSDVKEDVASVKKVISKFGKK